MKLFNGDSLRLAISSLMQTYGNKYPGGEQYLQRIDALIAAVNTAAANAGKTGDSAALEKAVKDFDALRQEALLNSPLFDFDKLLLVQRNPQPTRPAAELAGQLRRLRSAATTTRSPCSRR